MLCERMAALFTGAFLREYLGHTVRHEFAAAQARANAELKYRRAHAFADRALARDTDALLRALPPRITVVVSDPFYPDPDLPPRSARRDLHEKVYSFLCDTVSARRSYAHIEYLPAQDQNPAAR